MSSDYHRLNDAFRSLAHSTAALNALSFSSPNILPRTVLSPDDFFETHLIRDAAPHELALFEPNPATNDFSAGQDPEELLRRQNEDDRWMATKRRAPQRVAQKDKASPLKQTRNQTTAGHAVDEPDRCLRAAKKLLDIYTMPRATDHVFALHSQWVGVVDAISDLEESLRRPPSRPTPQPQHSDSYYRLLELEDAIKREQLELFALEQLKAEKEAEVAALRPSRPASAADRKVPSVVANARSRAPKPAAPPADDDLLSEESPDFNPFGKSNKLDQPGALPPPVPVVGSGEADEQPQPKPKKRVPAVVAAAMRGRPSTGAAPSAPASPAKRPIRPRPSVARNLPAPAPPALADEDLEATPKAARTAPPRARSPSPPPPPPAAPKKSLPAGVNRTELDLMMGTVWKELGDVAGLRGWGRKWAREERKAHLTAELEQEDGKAGVEETIEILRHALFASTAALSEVPHSPSGGSITSFSTLSSTASTSGDPSAPPSPWSPAQLMEGQLLNLLLSTFSGSSSFSPSADLPPLAIVLREPLPSGQSQDKTPCIAMAGLKAHLGAFAKERGWTEEMGTTAVYGMVSKNVARIDRRGGAAVGFRT
ncbi:hypothetical protein JCM10213_007979 [Rhodosporidiobolus nylandii]